MRFSKGVTGTRYVDLIGIDYTQVYRNGQSSFSTIDTYLYTPSCWPKFGYGAWSSKWLLAQSFAPLLCLPAVLLDIDLSLEHGQNLILVFPFRRANVSRSHASWLCQWIHKQSNFKPEALSVRSNASPIAGSPRTWQKTCSEASSFEDAVGDS